ncbi:MAG: hypothetical protein ACRDJG_02685 [Actinomycetota bacterium]
MPQRNSWTMVVLAVASLALSGCTKASVEVAREEPAKIERVEGTNLKRLILSKSAVKRLDIQTALVHDQTAPGGAARKVIPYAAVIYDPTGDTWTYTNPTARTFLRHRIQVDDIEGDLAVLSDGPPSGTPVVTVGAAELFGIEFEVGH